MQRLKKDDLVQVISGNEIGAQGQVKSMVLGWRWDRKKNRSVRHPNGDRIIVTGVNFCKKHQGRVKQARQTGIIEVEAPIHISNVMLVCPGCDEATRVRFSFEEAKKVRVCKRCHSTID